MQLYTRKGDAGFTSLSGSRRVRKDDPRIEACGMIDELNCWIGHAAAEARRVRHDTIYQTLADVQPDLFTIGARLAALGAEKLPRALRHDAIEQLERHIDVLCSQLPFLKQLTRPDGCELAMRLHLARTVCRRAERAVVHLLNPRDEQFIHDPLALRYLNRLSDLLFVTARLANQDAGVPEQSWPPLNG